MSGAPEDRASTRTERERAWIERVEASMHNARVDLAAGHYERAISNLAFAQGQLQGWLEASRWTAVYPDA